jgi:hypothetical protein
MGWQLGYMGALLKVLAWGVAALTALAALVAAGPALGGNGERSYAAEFEQGGSIMFRLERGDDPRVRDIYIDGMAGQCEEGNSVLLGFSISGSTPVLSDRTFAVRSKDAYRGKAVVRGRFSRNFRRAKGRARVYGRFLIGDTTFNCDSGKQRFVAREPSER